MSTEEHSNHLEVKSLLDALAEADYVITGIDNGGGTKNMIDPPADMADLLPEILASDTAVFTVEAPGGRKQSWLFLVFGNGPGEVVCDFSLGDADLEALIEAESDKFSQ